MEGLYILEKAKGLGNRGREARVLFSGFTPCNYCGCIIWGKVVFIDGYSYLDKSCSFCNNFSRWLLIKGEFIKKQKSIPAYWPNWQLEVGDKQISEENVKNLKNVPCVVMKLNTQCNSNCCICGIKDIEPPIDRSIEFIREKLKLFKNQEIDLCGGEPTVREDLLEIIRLIKKSGNYPAITTNGLKLADSKYLKRLVKSGLKHIYLSFDGFKSEIYQRIRGGAHELDLKLKALENISKAKVRLTLFVTLIRGLNDGQISEIIRYCQKNDFINDIWFKPLFLNGREEWAGFNKESLLSKEEIRKVITGYLGISQDYFDLWDELKLNLAALFAGRFPGIRLPVFDEGKIYLLRRKDKLLPLLTKAELNNLNKTVREGEISIFIKPRYLGWFIKLIGKLFIQAKIEDVIFKRGAIVRIGQNECGAVREEILISDYPVIVFPYRIQPMGAGPETM